MSRTSVDKIVLDNDNHSGLLADYKEIITRFHSESEAITAKESWINDVQKDNKPTDIPEIELLEKGYTKSEHPDFLVGIFAAAEEIDVAKRRATTILVAGALSE